MKYCDDDVKNARDKIHDIEIAANMVKLCTDCIKLNNDEKMLSLNVLDMLNNIVKYGNNLEDDKLNKLLRMKMIIEEGCK